MIDLLYILALLWVVWLLIDGLLTKNIWVKGGAKDRFTRPLDMSSFAHKVNRSDSPITYWLHVVLYCSFIILVLYLLIYK